MRASALVWGGRVIEATRAGKREVDEPVRGLEEGRRYSWVEDHLARLDGKEARGEYYAWLISTAVMDRSVLRADRLRATLDSAVVGLLLFSVVASTIAGAGAVLYGTVLTAWLLFPLLVGFRNTLDAGCAFMLISLGVVVVVEAAQNGPGSLVFP